MKKFVCSVCGYVHTAEELAADFRCPVCKVPASKFVEQKGEMKLAAEHEYGVYAKTVKNNPDISAEDKKYIFEQLMANFQGECSEVGMYPEAHVSFSTSFTDRDVFVVLITNFTDCSFTFNAYHSNFA